MRACRRSQSREQRHNKGSGSAWSNEAAAEFGAARPSPISKGALLPVRGHPM
jgi:hypothetical protein